MSDMAHAALAADAAARGATALRDDPNLQAALKRLEAHYLGTIRASLPDQASERESAYFMLRALDALRHDIDAAISGAEITRRNLRSVTSR
jgi:hypothetical protein